MNSRRPPRSRRRAAPGHHRHEHQPAPNPVLHQAIMDIVDNQVRDDTPPETRRTLERLVATGHTLEDARRLIGCVVSTAIYDVLAQHRPFDEAAYVAALQRLPILPWEDEPASS